MKHYLILFLLVGAIAVNCSVQNVGPNEYMKWIKDEQNGLRVSKEVNGYKFTLQYKPCEFEALLHKETASFTKQQFDSVIAPIKNIQFFTFCINSPDKKDPVKSISRDETDYNQRLNYLMFEMQNDFSLIDGKDTLSCLFYHYERNFDVSPDNNILLGFEEDISETGSGDKTIIYNDKILETGPIMLTIKSKSIKAVPVLNLNN